MPQTPLEIALWLWRRGLSVIPVPRPRPGVPAGDTGDGKVPAIAWREYQDRLATETELRGWFDGEPMNIAIVTGALSGLVVIDADSDEALHYCLCVLRLPYTPWQVKTKRGFHLFYRHPGDGRIPNRSKLTTREGRMAVDVRGDGGYTIAPGSVHASGVVYEFGGDWRRPRADVPMFWRGWLERPQPRPPAPRPRPSSRPTGDVVERARQYLASIPRPEIGDGSDAAVLYAACRVVRGFDLPISEATSLLWEWCGNRPGWTWAWVAKKVANADSYGSEPIGGLR